MISPADSANPLQGRTIETPLGDLFALAGQDGLYLLEFADRRELASEIARLRQRTRAEIVSGTNPHLDKIGEELHHYFAGIDLNFTVPLKPLGTPFELAAWNLLHMIRPGETWPYARLAQQLGRPRAVRAVGHANGKNSLALVIPCHRLVGSDGSLCGYGGGLWRKQWLLDHERRYR